MAETQIELLGFMLSDEQYALDILEIKEIVRLLAITPVPRSPSWLKGIVTLRGVIVPIFDLRSRLGLAEIEYGPKTRIIVVYRGEELAGLIVDSLRGQQEVVIKSVGSVFRNTPGIAGATELGDKRAVLVLDVGALIDEATHR